MSGSYANSVNCTAALTNYMNTNYSGFVSPTLGTNQAAIPVVVQALLFNFLSLDTDKTLSVVFFLYFSWLDVHMPDLIKQCGNSFTSSSYLSLNSSLIWTPDIFLALSATDSTSLPYWWSVSFGYFDNSTNVQPTMLTQVTSACTGMDLTNFPYDSQTCNIIFFAPSDPVVFTDNGAFNAAAGKSNDWTVTEVDIVAGNYSFSDFTYPSFTVTVIASRDAYYFVINLIYPTILMAAMLCLVFIMPCDEGEKTLLSATLVLGLYIMQQTISVILPDVSDQQVPVILTITTLVFVSSVASLFEAVLVQTLCLVAPESFPKAVNEFMVTVFVRCCKKEKSEEEEEEIKDGKIIDEVEVEAGLEMQDDSDVHLALMRKLVHLQKQKLEILEKQRSEAEEHELYEIAWFRFQYVVNVLSLIAYIIVVAIPFATLSANASAYYASAGSS